jgi:hypothetical protein
VGFLCPPIYLGNGRIRLQCHSLVLNQGFNKTWFCPEPARSSLPGSRQHAIYAVSWEQTEDSVRYPLMWTRNASANALDVTRYYLEAALTCAASKLAETF